MTTVTCARAIARSDLWNAEKHVGPKNLPTPGDILAVTSCETIEGKAYDEEWPERAKATMWWGAVVIIAAPR